MATRFYLPSSGTAPASPTPSTVWDTTTGVPYRPMDPAKSNSTIAAGTARPSTGVANNDALDTIFVSAPLAAQTITGTFSLVIKAMEDSSTANAILQVVISVYSGDGSTRRGTLYAGTSATTAVATVGAANEEYLNATAATRVFNAVAVSSVAASEGDRIAVELGTRFTGGTSSRVATLTYGDPSATGDYALTSGLATALCPWIELSANIAFYVAPGNDVFKTPSDIAGGTDSATETQVLPRPAADTAAGADSAVPVQTFLRTPGDTAAGSDSAVPVQTFLRSQNDTADGSDAATFDFSVPTNDVVATPADTAAGSDAATEVQDYLRTGADTAAGSDAATPVQTFDRAASDTAAGADAVSPTWDRVAVTGGTGAVVLPTLIGSTAVDDASGILTRNLTVPAGVGPTHLGIIMVGSNTGTAATLSAPGWTARVGATAVNERWSILTRLGGHTAGDTITVTSSGAQQAHVAAIWLDTAGADLDVIGAPTVRSVSVATCLAAGITLPSPEPVLVISTERTTATGTTVTGVTPAVETTLYYREGAASNSVSHLVTAYDPGAAGLTADQTVTYNSASTNGGAVQFSLVSVVAGPPADRADGSDSASAVLSVGGINRVENPADTAAGLDSVTATATRDAAVADVAAGADAATATAARDTTASDGAAGADAATTVRGGAASPADTAAGADSLTTVVDRPNAFGDTAAGADAATAVFDHVAVLADTAAGSDQATRQNSFSATPADAAAGTDTVTLDRATSPADAATGGDTATTVRTGVVVIGDTAAGADDVTVQRAGVGAASLTDTANGSDSADPVAVRPRSAVDTADGSDAVALGRTAAAADTAGGTDLATVGATRDRTAADTAAGSDSASAVTTSGRTENPNDIATGADTATVLWTRSTVVADTAAGSDLATTAKLGAGQFPADNAAGSDAVTVAAIRDRSANDIATGADVLAIGRITLVNVGDPATGTDNATSDWSRVGDVADLARGADEATFQFSGADSGVPVYDVDVVVRPYAGKVLVTEAAVEVVTSAQAGNVLVTATGVRAVVREGGRVLVKVGTDG